jgi:ABC-2 type transport system ATP-binding protein
MTGRFGSNGSVVVRTRRLSRAFGDRVAVDGLDLEVAAGQVRALVGLNGAGKSTLMRLMVGLIRPGSGSAELWGVPAWQAPATVRARIGYVSSGRTYAELTVTEHLTWSARLHGCPRRDAKRRASHQIDRLVLGPWASKPARTLSSGNRQRLAVASALIHDPDLLILDEPTNALDPAGVIELRRIIADRAEQGAAVFVSSHHLDEMARLASVIDVMHDGRLVGALPPDGVDLERQFFHIVAAATAVAR